ncbi:MAG: alpha/beta fold hydrolase [Gemmatimonadaceae bacterium]|nr:alpha/beta fold hydrolase [Gemmatimonadaceae bacterium]NUQ91812.1 alpha/beta fold hydrolase [Gemmatimonadaceae bacterium]NUR20634.1 alpha/beta fold hydrolase [Gemmatimonadaceae bacterium]
MTDDTFGLAHEESGEGFPVILLHGFPHDHTLWAAQMTGLEGHCRVIAPDLRGFGESVATPPYTIDRYADDVIALMDRLGIERAVIGGLSMGGYIAFSMWRRHRARFRGLMLIDTRAGADGDEAKQRRAQQIEVVRRDGVATLAPRLVESSVSARTRERHPEVVERLLAMMSRQPAEGVAGALQAMTRRADSTPTLKTIDVPTLIVVGAEDVATPVEDARKMHEAIAGSTLEIIEGAGHLSNLERPAAVNHVMSEFIARLIYA